MINITEIPVLMRDGRITDKHDQRPIGAKINRIVLHDTAGNSPGCITWLTEDPPLGSANSSCHLVVDKAGTIFRLVPDELMAWHCRGYNSGSIGIELERAKDDETSPYPETQITAAAALVAAVSFKHKIPLNRIDPHSELDPERRRDPRNFPFYDFMFKVAEILVAERRLIIESAISATGAPGGTVTATGKPGGV